MHVLYPCGMQMDKSSGQKITFHDLSPREYMYFPKGILEMGRPGQSSTLELTHIVFAMLVLTIAFSFPLSQNSLLKIVLTNQGFNVSRLPSGFAMSFVAIVSAFFCHELSHKLMAQHYKLWSEFRMYTKGLLTSLLLSVLTGFVFATPGAVMFQGDPRPFEEGKIAMAGPLANMILACIFLPLFLFVFYYEPGAIRDTIGIICLVNIVFALFNLFPFGPLDGVKIFQWSPAIWTTMFIISGCMMILLFPFVRVFIS